jgi:hypothetical protein
MFLKSAEDTVASNPGNLSLQWRHYLRYAREQVIVVAAAAAISIPGVIVAWLCGSLPWTVGLGFLPIASLWRLKDHLQDMRRHFRMGCVNPAVVVSDDPVLIAAFTDLSKSDDASFPAIRIVRGHMQRLGLPRPRVGDRLATVSLYEGNIHDGTPSWTDFHPYPASAATSDQAALERVMASIPAEDWTELTQALAQVPQPFETGLYPIKGS